MIGSTADHSEVELATYYSALAGALQKHGMDDDMTGALEEGSIRLAEKLGRIRSRSIRNSLMTRRETTDFTGLCLESGLPFPPDGFFFGSAADSMVSE